MTSDNRDVRLIDIMITHGVALITMDRKRQIINDGGVVINNGFIVTVGESSELERAYKAERGIDVQGGVVQPGFIDCHVHTSLHLGKISLEKGNLTQVDEGREYANIDRAARKLFDRIDVHPEKPWPVVP